MSWRSVAIVVLAGLAVAGYLLNVQLFNSISFVFGSIAALVAVRMLGLGWGVAIGFLGASCTYFMWGHPYAVFVFTVEILVVGMLVRRFHNVSLADAVFWLFLGAPAVVLLYRFGVGLSWDAATFIAVKQAVNGVFNALVAGLIMSTVPLAVPRIARHFPQTSLQAVLFKTVAVISITSAGVLISVGSNADYRRTLDLLASDMTLVSEHVRLMIGNTPENTGMADTIESNLTDLLQASDNDLRSVAHYSVALVGADGSLRNIVGTTLSTAGGRLETTEETALQRWAPTEDMAAMVRSEESRYVLRREIPSDEAFETVIVEFDASPVIDRLEADGRRDLVLLLACTVLILLITRTLIRWVSGPLLTLAEESRNITPAILAGRTPPDLPSSIVSEYDVLARSLRNMSAQLSRAFRAKTELAETLEARVAERTAKLTLLSEVARQTTNGVVVTDPEGRVTWVNEAFEDLSGYTLGEIRGKIPGQVLQKVPPPESITEHMRTSIARRLPFHVEILNHSKTDEPYWIELRSNPMWDADGKISGFIAVQHDVTERRRTFEALEANLERLDLAADVAELGIWSFDPHTGRSDWNDQNYDLHGLQHEDDLHRGWLDSVHPDDAQHVVEAFKQLLDEVHGDFAFEYRVNHPERGERILSSTARVVWDDEKLHRVTGVTRDVTDERHANQQLRRSAKHTETILDNVVDGIITVNVNGVITSCNRSAETIFGYRSAEIEGSNIGILMPREHAARHDGYINSYLGGSAPKLIGRTREFEGVRKNGEVFPIELTVSEIESCQAGGRFFIGIVRDISERKKVERMQSEFLATVSHELRTPLTSVRGTLSLLDGGVLGELNENGGSMVDAALRNTHMLEDLIDDMLDLEKLTQGKMEIDLGFECLPTLVHDAVKLNQAFADKYGVQLSVHEPLPRLKVHVDASRAIQILTNFLSNAVKHSERGDTVTISARANADHVRLSVIDTGPGVPKDKQGILFQKFAQVDTSDSRKRRGTGLGLAITRELATRMGGKVGLVSEEGQGSEFWVDFLVEGAADQRAALADNDPDPPHDDRPSGVINA